MCHSWCVESGFCEYKSTRFIRVRNPKLVFLYYFTMFLVLVYVVVYTILLQKGYQATDNVVGTTSVKLKGSASVGSNRPNASDPNTRVLDAMDLVQPSIEENAFFITLSYLETPNQTQRKCDGNSDVKECTLADPHNCTVNSYDKNSQGIITGACSPNPGFNTTQHYCEVYSWCPLEIDDKALLKKVNGVGSFTAFVKVDIEFPAFGVARTTTVDRDGTKAPVLGYNLWSIDDIIKNAANKNYKDIAVKGAIILMSSSWDCNLDLDKSKCNPKWKFSRIDDQENTISSGFNFRTVEYNEVMTARLLRKLIGLRVVFVSSGKAGKFSFAVLTVTFGAGLAYLGLASVLTDVVLVNFMKNSNRYDYHKNEVIEDSKESQLLSASHNYKDPNNTN